MATECETVGTQYIYSSTYADTILDIGQTEQQSAKRGAAAADYLVPSDERSFIWWTPPFPPSLLLLALLSWCCNYTGQLCLFTDVVILALKSTLIYYDIFVLF